MKKSLACSLLATAMLASTAAQANAPVSVTSKEYKVLLNPSQFASNPATAAASLLAAVKTRLTQLNFDKTVTGSFAAGDRDQISYYDVAGSCTLHNAGYSVRYRTGADNDIEFKYGHPDEELSFYTDVTGTGKNKSSKIETDVSPDKLVYSHSTEQDNASSGAPATISALISQFSGASVFSASSSQSLVPVAGLTLNQQEYDGPSSDIGNSDADFTLTLWYIGNATTPALAELSFRVDADSSSYFTTPVLQRSQVLMQAVSTLGSTWNLADSTTKTAWVYAFKSSAYPNGFCSQ